MKIKITNSEPKLISFWDIYGKELDVKNTKTVNFASGPKNYYVVEFEGREYEVPEDMVDNSIPNNYEGKTPEQVWNAWTEDQREHFLKDHFKDKINPISQSEIIKSNYSGLFNWWNFNIKEKLEEHLKSGQYGKGGGVDNDEFQEAAEFLMDKTVFSYSLGQLEPTEHKIKGIHITPKHFNQRHLYFSFYGNEWPANFNDYDRLTADQLADFIAGEEVELKDSQGEPYIVALGDIAGKGKKVDSINVGDDVIPLTGEYSGEVCRVFGVYPEHDQVDIMPVSTLDPRMANYKNMRHYKLNEVQKAAKGTKIESLNIGDEVEFINDSGVTKSRGKIIDIDSDGKYATIDWKDGTHLFYRNINKIWKYNDQAAKGTKIENMDFETRFSKFIKELSWLSNKTGVVIGGHYNDALGEYIEYTNDWTSGDIWRGGKSRETTDAPKGYYRFIKGLEAISNKYGIEVHSTGHVITEHNGMVKYTDDPTSGDINYKELNGKGSKIKENMENKNYYYLKIGNRIIETFGGFSMTGSTKGGQYIYEIIGHNPTGIMVREHTITKSKKTEPFEISFYDLTKYMNAEAKGYQVEGCPMENMRDEALLDMEIADIKNSFKIAEEKAEVRKKEAEVAQVKHEADVLLKKAVDTEAAAKDTIEALAELAGDSTYDRKLKTFLDKFPNDAKSWGQATDEIRDIARAVREAYNEQVLDVVDGDPGYVEGLNFREFGKPSQWNTEAKKFILKYWALLPERVKKDVLDSHEGWFDQAGRGKKVGGKKKEWLIEDEAGHRKVVEMETKPKVGELVTTAEWEGGKKTIVSKVIGKHNAGKGAKVKSKKKDIEREIIMAYEHQDTVRQIADRFGMNDGDVENILAKKKKSKKKDIELFKKEAKIGKYYHFRLNNPKGVNKCAVPSWASDLAGSVYEGAKITTCQKDGEWFAQNVMIPTKNISKLQARSYAQQIALKIKK